jgi:hypothetical protein
LVETEAKLEEKILQVSPFRLISSGFSALRIADEAMASANSICSKEICSE